MKKVLLVFILLFITVVSFSQQIKRSENPIFDGWYADPHAVIYGKTYWVYPTTSLAFDKQISFDCFSSPDLVHWTKYSDILDTSSVRWAKGAMWAPAAFEKQGKYYLFFSANNIQSSEQIGGIGVAVASSPQGPYRDLLGEPLIGEIVNGTQPIDQFVFEQDGSYYMYYGGWGHCNLVKLKEDFTSIVPFEDGTLYKEVTPEGFVEGVFMNKINGKYYFMWSEGNWTGPDYQVAYAVADSFLGPFKRIGVILGQDTSVARGAGHHSLVNIPGTDHWYIFYHRRPLNAVNGHHRETCIEKVSFDENGLIRPVSITTEGVEQHKIE